LVIATGYRNYFTNLQNRRDPGKDFDYFTSIINVLQLDFAAAQ
jgi:hypothetical protein